MKSNRKKPSYLKYIVAIWLLYGIGLLVALALFVGISRGALGPLPSFVDLENPKNSLASEVYYANGELMGKFFVKDRSNITFDELPSHLVDALVATEDVRFRNHAGIDFRALVRAVANGGKDGGGSTISQQLAKNLFHTRETTFKGRLKQKLKEWVIAVKLERSYTKEEIITMYLNTVPFSHNTYGISAASNVYFSCSPDSLAVQEAAVLVGMLKANTKYNPKRNPNNAKNRRNEVLGQMVKYGKITEAEHDSLVGLDLVVKFSRKSHSEGPASYFREFVRSEVKKWSKNSLKVDGSKYDVHRDGLKIYTTIDPVLQKYAEEAVSEHMSDLQELFYKRWGKRNPWDDLPKITKKRNKMWAGTNDLIYRAVKNSERYANMNRPGAKEEDIKKAFETPTEMSIFSWKGDTTVTMTPLDSIAHYKMFLQTGFMAIDPTTGHILAWVGGVNHSHFKYDNVRPSSKKQVGSTFKPFVYTIAMQNGWSPCRKIPNVAVTFDDYDNWTPKNSSNSLNGQMVSIRQGLALSLNWITAYLMKEITPEPVKELAQKMGIESNIEAVPSICLGTPEISLYEMLGAYSTFANKGFYTRPISYVRIEDKNGNEIQSFPSAQREVISDKTAYAMLDLLQGVTNEGTGQRIRWKYGLEGDISGKTGTTNDNSDGWYIGMTPQIVAGAWVGGDEKTVRFEKTKDGAGSNMSLPIWGLFMQKVYADSSLNIQPSYFERPENMDIELDCSRYTDPALPPNLYTPDPNDTTNRAIDPNNPNAVIPAPKKSYDDEFDE